MDNKGLKVERDNIKKIYATNNYNKRSILVYKKLASCSFDDLSSMSLSIIDDYFKLYQNSHKSTFLDATYIECLTEKDKYDYYLKGVTGVNYSSFYKIVDDAFNELKTSYKYAKKTCDYAALNNPIEKKIYKNSAKYIISGKRTFTVKDAKIISRYFLNKECVDNDLYLVLSPYKKALPSINFYNLKDSILDLKEAIYNRFNHLGEYDMDDEICLNYKVLRSKRNKYIVNPKFDVLSTIFHESHHAFQQKLISDPSSYDYDILYMCKEFLVTNNSSYYKTNYEDLFYELDAEIYGDTKALEVIKKYNIDLYNKIYPLLEEKIKISKKNLEGYRSHNVDGQFYEATDAVENKFLDYFNKDTAESLIKAFPILELQYNKDGTYKSIKELKKVKEKCLKNGADSTRVNILYDNLKWQYIKAKTNINNFYSKQAERVNKTIKK